MASTEGIDMAVYGASRSSRDGPMDQQDASSRMSPFDRQEHQQMTLPRADGGRQAWLFLAGSFMIEALLWGFPFSFGVFKQYYMDNRPFSDAPSGITTIGTSAMGIMYLGSPPISMFLQRFPLRRGHVQIVGFVMLVTSLVLSSFATKVWHLIVTQGILYGVSGGLVYFPTLVYLDEWFIRRKGTAFGIMWAGTGVSGVVVPLIMNWGLSKCASSMYGELHTLLSNADSIYRSGYATMLRCWAVVLALLTAPLLYFVKPRIPVTGAASHSRRVSFGFLQMPAFWVLQAGNIAQGLGFFMPNIYLPSYASTLGLSTTEGAVTVALFNVASVFGAVIVGSLTDRLHVTSVTLISALGATFSVFLFWGLAGSLPLLCVFGIVYGLFAGGFSSTYSGISVEIQRRDERAEFGLVIGTLAAGRGIGSVVSGPLSEALVNSRIFEGDAALGYGSGYSGLIIFTGVTALLGGASWMGRRVGWV